MAAFPSIADPSSITEMDLSFRTKEVSSAGYTMVRSRSTLIKKRFSLSWMSMTAADKATLITFFGANNSLSITWTHFETSTTYDVCFKDDQLKFSYLAPGFWKIELAIEEI